MHTLIAIPLLLIAIAAGFMLLAKSQKYSLGGVYKIASYFIITTATLALICCFLCCFMQMCCKNDKGCNKGGCDKEMMMMHNGGPHGGMMMNGPCEKKMMIQKECKMDDKCEMESECKEGGDKDCCKNKDKVVKDTVITKTK